MSLPARPHRPLGFEQLETKASPTSLAGLGGWALEHDATASREQAESHAERLLHYVAHSVGQLSIARDAPTSAEALAADQFLSTVPAPGGETR